MSPSDSNPSSDFCDREQRGGYRRVCSVQNRLRGVAVEDLTCGSVNSISRNKQRYGKRPVYRMMISYELKL